MGIADSKLGKVSKPKLGKDAPSLAGKDAPDTCTPIVELSKSELGSLAPLEPREKIFVDEYLIDLNATQATIRAGYSPKAARQMSAQLMAKPPIRAAIAIAQDAQGKRTERAPLHGKNRENKALLGCA